MIRMMIRSSVLAVVLASLVTSAAFAAPIAGRTAPVPSSGLAVVWKWVTLMLGPVLPVSKAPGGEFIEKAGSHMDPDGIS